MGPRNRFQGMNSASLCSLAGRYNSPIPTRCLAPIDFLKIPALESKKLVILPFLMAVFVFLNFFICKQSKNLTHTKWISGEKGNLICRRLKGKGYISLRRSLIHMRKISGKNSNLSLFRCFCYTSLDRILQVLYSTLFDDSVCSKSTVSK